MKCAIVLFSALALIGHAAVAVNAPWRAPPRKSLIQEYESAEEMDYAYDEPQLLQSEIQREIGEPTFSNDTTPYSENILVHAIRTQLLRTRNTWYLTPSSYRAWYHYCTPITRLVLVSLPTSDIDRLTSFLAFLPRVTDSVTLNLALSRKVVICHTIITREVEKPGKKIRPETNAGTSS